MVRLFFSKFFSFAFLSLSLLTINSCGKFIESSLLNNPSAASINYSLNLDPLNELRLNTPIQITGSCSPDGNDIISIDLSPGFIPSSVPNCDCRQGSIECPSFTFSALPQNPLITVVQSTGPNDTVTATLNPTVNQEILLEGPDVLTINNPTVFYGKCAPEGSSINISIPDSSPNTIGPCICSNGSFQCDPVNFTSLPANPNVTLTGPQGSGSSQQNFPVTAQIDLDDSQSVRIGSAFSLSGSCTPNGNNNIHVELQDGFVPADLGPCDCNNGSINCPSVVFTSIPENPEITAEIENGAQNSDSDSIIASIENFVQLTNPGPLNIGSPITFNGSCSPNNNDVSIAINGAIPSSIGPCSCNNGQFNCSPTTFTSLPPNPILTITGKDGGNSSHNALVNSYINLNEGSSIAENESFNLSGTCGPNGNDVLLISLAQGFVPSNVGPCDCIEGLVSCEDMTFTSIPSTPTITVTATGGSNGNVSDSITPETGPFVSLNTINNLAVGSSIAIEGNCAPEGAQINIEVPGASPENIGPCTCSSGSFSCPSTTFTKLPSSPTLTATNNQGGTDSQTVSVNDSVALTGPFSVSIQTPTTFTGTCGPEGSSVNLSLSGITPSNIGPCSCLNGSFSCPETTFTSITENVSLSISQGSASENHNLTVVPTVDLVLETDDVKLNEAVAISGTCGPNSNNSIVMTSARGFMTPPGPITCSCQNGAIVSCTDNSNNSVTELSFSKNDAVEVVISTSSAQGTDRELANFDPLQAKIFGWPLTDFWEDGREGFCIKIGPKQLKCSSNYSFMEDASTYLPENVSIDTFASIESSVFLFNSDESVWSGGAASGRGIAREGAHNVPGKVNFPEESPSRPVMVTGHHYTGCFLHEDGDVTCFNMDNDPVERIDQDAQYVYSGLSYSCYVSLAGELKCNDQGYSETPLVPPLSTLDQGVQAWISGNYTSSSYNKSVTFYEDGTLASGTAYTVGNAVSGGFKHSGSRQATFMKSPHAVFIDDQGQVIVINGNSASVVSAMGTDNLDVTSSAGRGTYYVLKEDGRIFSHTGEPQHMNMNGNSFGKGTMDDFKIIKGYYNSFCAVRENNEIHCYGSHAGGGTFDFPLSWGTYNK